MPLFKAGQNQELKDFATQYGISANVLRAKEFDTYMKNRMIWLPGYGTDRNEETINFNPTFNERLRE
jgi:hypothetical protein